MANHRIIGGQVVTTPESVFAGYAPSSHKVPAEAWQIIRPVAVAACRQADFVSVATAHEGLRYTAYFLYWAVGTGAPLDLETVFVPSMVERFCSTQLRGLSSEARSTARSRLRKVGRACTRKAPWPAEPGAFADNHVIKPPYTGDEVDALWDTARAQVVATKHRVAAAMLALGLGAGLKPGEMLSVEAADVRVHPEVPGFVVVSLADRIVPVLRPSVPDLLHLVDQYAEGPLVGTCRSLVKDPLGRLREEIRWPDWIKFTPSRLRTTWMASVLTHDVRIGEFMQMAGTVSSKSLEVNAAYVPGRWSDYLWLQRGAGL